MPRALVLLAFVSGCGAAQPTPVAPSPTPPVPRNDAALAEPTVVTAGGDCRLGPVQPIGTSREKSPVILGFGSHFGAAAWETDQGIAVRNLSRDGTPMGEARIVPIDATPLALVPAGRGFLLIATEPVTIKGTCWGRCRDATCASNTMKYPPQVCFVPCSRVCERLIHHRIHAVALSPNGQTTQRAATDIGRDPVIAVSAAHGGALGMITGDHRWVALELSDDAPVFTQHDTTLQPYIVPVRGEGPAAFVTGELRDLDAIITRDGKTSIQTDPDVLSFAMNVMEARVQARYGADGRIHVAWIGWMKSPGQVGYAVLDGSELRFTGAEQAWDEGLRAPFEDYVEARVENGRLVRSSWLSVELGDPVPVGSSAKQATVSWNGNAFVLAYRRGTELVSQRLACGG